VDLLLLLLLLLILFEDVIVVDAEVVVVVIVHVVDMVDLVGVVVSVAVVVAVVVVVLVAIEDPCLITAVARNTNKMALTTPMISGHWSIQNCLRCFAVQATWKLPSGDIASFDASSMASIQVAEEFESILVTISAVATRPCTGVQISCDCSSARGMASTVWRSSDP